MFHLTDQQRQRYIAIKYLARVNVLMEPMLSHWFCSALLRRGVSGFEVSESAVFALFR